MFALIGLSATVVAAVFSFCASASAAPAAATALQNVATESCLDSSVHALRCSGSASQQWELDIGTTLKNVATGLCLDSDASKQVYTSPCNGGSYQRWAIGTGARGGTLRHLATGFCLDSSADMVRTAQCTGGDSQQWKGI